MVGIGPILEANALIWHKVLQPKHRFILWLAAQRRLLTRRGLISMGLDCDSDECVLCDMQHPEDSKHLFLDCPWAVEVWNAVSDWTRIQLPHLDIHEALHMIKHKNWTSFKKEIATAVIEALVYNIWTTRNWKFFRGQTVNINFVVQQMKIIIRERL
ncbi:uncharacterized protein LOC132607725 [Lycium barbarum]|uniref:uncharacterized protein LOC132607725 n=1 Tax=Lycium barbarum TaxID=112863 RepID=UPI00293F5969|nr:uncharacterized protein LOC132607725 [Lycium barbarum]